MKLFIVIAVFNRKEITLNCISLLHDQDYQEFNVVVVDDGSSDGTYEAIRTEYPEVHLIKGTGDWWWTKSTNEGIKFAINKGADTILILNNDIIFSENYLSKMVNISKHNPKAIIGSLDITKEEPKRIFFSGVKRIIWWKAKQIKYHKGYDLYDPTMNGLHKSICLNGRGTIIPVEVFNKIGFLDEERLPQYASDFDLTIRADKAGISTFISWDAVVYSYVKETGAGKPFIKQSFGVFLKSFFGKYSQTSLSTLYVYYKKHCRWYYLHFAFTLQILRLIYSYFKRRNAFINID